MQILLAGRTPDQLDTEIKARAPDAVIRQWSVTGDIETMRDQVRAADVVLIAADAAGDRRIVGELAAAPRLRFVQLAFAGHDWLRPAMLPAGCAVSNTHEHSSAIGEYVLASILDATVRLGAIDAAFRSGSWAHSGTTGRGIKHGLLQGKTVGIVGYGHIGRDVARRLAPFGVEILAQGREAVDPPPAPLARFAGPEGLDDLLGRSDFIVLSCALNEATRGLIDVAAFDRMKPDAVLVNVSRGPVVEERALFEALRERRIRRAYIDVWYQYPTAATPHPRPGSFPFEELDNLVMTPHCSAWTEGQEQRRCDFLAENIARWVHGEPPLNRIALA
ncbi:phosphoglycerate dehydrogenase [Variovorax sp. PDNC026]|uniref:2-hydroxyacid dehydrogenase n=1 Tax=Variovorax sp. PDNC026 TaxID=2811425 RepID=UPI001962F0E0|nr:2-hydroxyacid dehydrogenase [Variovorax sp. PDNC026]QRY31839.1 phosphoglycerate dehydrogenase [Variovorax sp. PDNC026]